MLDKILISVLIIALILNAIFVVTIGLELLRLEAIKCT